MIKNLSWNVQKEGRFGMNTFLGSGSGSQLAKNSFYQDASMHLAHCIYFLYLNDHMVVAGHILLTILGEW